MENEQPESLRDMLSGAVDQVESGNSPAVEKSIDTPAVSHETVATPQTESAGRTANRLRDDAGRLLPGKKETVAPATSSPQTAAADMAATAPVAAVPAIPAINRPSSWKKDHWEGFDKLARENPALAQYINQRETEYASGVSTYKSEAEQARGLNEAIAPFLPKLQQNNIDPRQWIHNLGSAHERLALGSPQEKVAMGVQLIRDYGIDPQALFNAITNPSYQPPVQQQQPAFNPQQITQAIRQELQTELAQREIQSEYQKFTTAKDDAGNPKYPHFEAVKETMAGLLQAELAQDYPSAYEAALRHPRHNDIFTAMQQQQRVQEDAAKAAEQRALVTHKRSQAVSVKSSTPVATSPLNGKTSLRDTISSVADDVLSSRV